MIAHVEASIDFPDEDIEEVTYEDLEERALKVKEKIENYLKLLIGAGS